MPRSCCPTLRRYRATMITGIHSSRMHMAGFSGCLLGGSRGVVSAWDVCTGGCLFNGVSAQGSVCPGDGCLPSRMFAQGWCLPGVFLPGGCLLEGVSTTAPMDRRNDTHCENITSLQLPLWVLITQSLKSLARKCVVLVLFCTLICGPYECRVYTDHESSNRLELFQLN